MLTVRDVQVGRPSDERNQLISARPQNQNLQPWDVPAHNSYQQHGLPFYNHQSPLQPNQYENGVSNFNALALPSFGVGGYGVQNDNAVSSFGVGGRGVQSYNAVSSFDVGGLQPLFDVVSYEGYTYGFSPQPNYQLPYQAYQPQPTVGPYQPAYIQYQQPYSPYLPEAAYHQIPPQYIVPSQPHSSEEQTYITRFPDSHQTRHILPALVQHGITDEISGDFDEITLMGAHHGRGIESHHRVSTVERSIEELSESDDLAYAPIEYEDQNSEEDPMVERSTKHKGVDDDEILGLGLESGDEADAELSKDTDEEMEDYDDEDNDESEVEKPAKKKSKAAPKKRVRNNDPNVRRKTKSRIHHGEVNEREDGSLWFRANGRKTWEPTVRHEPNRAAMVADRRVEGSYDVEPDGGHDDGNVTAYHPQQREWFYLGPHNWHHPTMDKWLYRFQRGDLPFRQEPVGVLRWRGQVVLNRQDIPITDWSDLPMTISSKIEGWRLEMWIRLDDRISMNDLADRMPCKPGMRTSALGNKRARFRLANGLASWEPRDGTVGYTLAIRKWLSPDQRRNNTTKGFLGLSKRALEEIKDDNREHAKGHYAKRAGANALTDEERQARSARKPQELSYKAEKQATTSRLFVEDPEDSGDEHFERESLDSLSGSLEVPEQQVFNE